jgi:hypothetical protein
MSEQGWDDAEFSCGRCPTRFHAGELQEFGTLVDLHDQVHDAAELLARLGGVPVGSCLSTAAAMVRAIVLDASPATVEMLRPAWDMAV